ncbi:uncharacterized protein J3D65DRAFT_668896 [Phyllosticta citribraziliensis]|uniref:Uncharacterized protein n=1 Tax=Phyllosticta citribraziliensis TaxID=989973 RepID=A0ABR1LHM6_9PEZI
MPQTSDNKRLFIELRSGHGRHRFIRRHSSTEHQTKRKHDRPAKPMRLSWSLSIETHSSKHKKRRSAKSRDSESGSSGTSRAAQAAARSETCRCWRGDGGAVRVDSDGSSLERIWGHLNDDDADSAATASVWGGERTHRVRRRRHGHHRPHNHFHYQHCRCWLEDSVPLVQQRQHQHQHIYYRPRVDNSQVQNNYSYERCPDDDDPRRDAPKMAGLEALLPDLEKLSLSREWSPEGREEDSLPPAYSEIYPRCRGTSTDRQDSVSGFPLREEYGGVDDSEECVWH